MDLPGDTAPALPAVRPHAFERVSLSRQFLLASSAALLVAMLLVGQWLADQIERNAVNRAATIAAVYIESMLAAQLREWPAVDFSDGATHAMFDRIFVDGPLRRKVVRFKLWSADGRIIYSSDHAQNGRHFPITQQLSAAFGGAVQARLSALQEADNVPERERWSRLLEVYVPVRLPPRDTVVAVAEFYHSTDNIGREIRDAKLRSWLLVGFGAAAVFLLLLVWVRRADHTIVDQQNDLRRQLDQLRAMLVDNERMRARLREAGAHTTALNERLLHRVAADIHDGPAQKIAFALMRFDELERPCAQCPQEHAGSTREVERIRGALGSSLEDVRNIASGLGMPGIAQCSLADVARHAVRDFERWSGTRIEADIDERLAEAPEAVKITTYRLLQESLANSHRHAPGSSPRASLRAEGGKVHIEVSDTGGGFDPRAVRAGRLGLAFMHERVRLLGGEFAVDSAPGRGARIRATLPLHDNGQAHA